MPETFLYLALKPVCCCGSAVKPVCCRGYWAQRRKWNIKKLLPLIMFPVFLQWVRSLPPWQCCPPPLKSCSRGRPHLCVWPTRASPQTGVCPGRWTAAAAAAAGSRKAAPGCCRRTATTSGAAPWGSLQTSGRRWALWPVRPNRAPRLQSYRHWGETSVPSPDPTHWDRYWSFYLCSQSLLLNTVSVSFF